MAMKRVLSLVTLLLLVVTLNAQTPQEVLKSIEKYPNVAATTYSTYPSIPFEELAPTPEGFEPFYFSLVGRHGSRYYRESKTFEKICKVFDKADGLGILTADGKLLKVRLREICEAQKGRNGEISDLGVEQWRAIAQRAYNRFTPIFRSGTVEAKSSISLRCIFSMAAFNESIKSCNTALNIKQNARAEDLWMVRPLVNDPAVPKEIKRIHKDFYEDGEWRDDRRQRERESKHPEFMSRITTDTERFLAECGINYSGRVLRYAFVTLAFGENFGKGDRALLTKLFTPEDMYYVYVHMTSAWLNNSMGRGNEIVEMRTSCMRPMVEDIITKAERAIEGKGNDVANLRFTHDSYVGPLLSVIGYDGCRGLYNKDLEAAATSFNLGEILPMAANLQIILYRDKAGKVYVRSLINERDATLPVKCATAPFYPWQVFKRHLLANMNELDKSRESALKKYSK